MVKRALLVLSLFIFVAILIRLNPPAKPELPQQTRWVKIDNNGEPMAPWAGPWRCVLDPKTQLLWEVKSYIEDIHDHQCSFSWYQEGIGAAKKGDCFIEGEASDTRDLIHAANAQGLCGVNNWRLPTEAELASLIYKTPKPDEPKMARDFFPFAKNGPYWTSTHEQPLTGHFKHLKKGAVAINFATGERQVMPYKNTAFVRLVAKSVNPQQQ